ncbi:MAG: ABC transporter ATP-binding protein [Thermodesulfobacteriota bacterium]
MLERDLAIQVEGLTKYYGNLLAVDHIHFEVYQGEIFGFLGPNGAGKTTTIRMLCGLLTPSEGKARVMGLDIQKETVTAKRKIGVVPEISNLYDELTCLENLIFMGQLYGVPKDLRKRRADELIQFFRLESKRDTLFSKLSKGMKRSLTISAALVHTPPLVFLDEPTSGLDVMSARNLRSMIRQLNQKGTTIFLTTHNIEEANQLCNRIAIIVKGKIIVIDTPEGLKQSVQGEFVVEIGVENPDFPDLLRLIKEMDGVKEARRNQNRFIIKFSERPRWEIFLPFLHQRGILITSVNTLQPTLEDAFVKITGLDKEIMMIEKEGKKG